MSTGSSSRHRKVHSDAMNNRLSSAKRGKSVLMSLCCSSSASTPTIYPKCKIRDNLRTLKQKASASKASLVIHNLLHWKSEKKTKFCMLPSLWSCRNVHLDLLIFSTIQTKRVWEKKKKSLSASSLVFRTLKTPCFTNKQHAFIFVL